MSEINAGVVAVTKFCTPVLVGEQRAGALMAPPASIACARGR